jgi:hypothetical protein
MDRRMFVQSLVAGGMALAADGPELKPLFAEIEKRHDEAVAAAAGVDPAAVHRGGKPRHARRAAI